ncbi:hypothetical protein R3P38DRAFT_2873487 [Favolaschia claudopus]|uniref:Uncharacterized protein n=1 Tax=Favolaschia claudopus TaxID=2862362 RepID=A0AAW0D1G8_9AGAR
MPAYRSKMCCAYLNDDLLTKRPRAPRPKKILTAEEKEEAKVKRAANKALKERRVAWEATLPTPLKEDPNFRHREGTLLTFKKDAMKCFGLTEREVATVRYEPARYSIKQYYALADVQALHQRKFAAGALLSAELKGTLRVLECLSSGGHRGKSNWDYIYDGDARLWKGPKKAKGSLRYVI